MCLDSGVFKDQLAGTHMHYVAAVRCRSSWACAALCTLLAGTTRQTASAADLSSQVVNALCLYFAFLQLPKLAFLSRLPAIVPSGAIFRVLPTRTQKLGP